MSRSRRPSERPVDLAAAEDPVAAFRAAHHAGSPVLLRTSGSLVEPRAVVRTTHSWTASFAAVSELAGIGPAARIWVPGPLTASMNLFAVVHAAFAGARLAPSPATATHPGITPAALARALDAHDLAGLTVIVAGDRLGPGLHDRARVSGAAVHHYYGAAELSFVAWGPHADALRLFPGVRARIRSGEIWVRSPYLCSDYRGPAGALRRDGDGFATVGDRGELDGDRLVVHGRADAVTTGGATVQVADIEAVLAPAARGDVAVVGVPHPELGAVVAAVLTAADDKDELADLARRLLAPAARPRLWFHCPDPPLTDAGKLDRAGLAALVADAPRPRRIP
ncbi:MAG: AMP-binding enzyme [Nocardioides sp.]